MLTHVTAISNPQIACCCLQVILDVTNPTPADLAALLGHAPAAGNQDTHPAVKDVELDMAMMGEYRVTLAQVGPGQACAP